MTTIKFKKNALNTCLIDTANEMLKFNIEQIHVWKQGVLEQTNNQNSIKLFIDSSFYL